MALIRFAEGQQRSGSIGATVYSHNRYGAYVRARSIPVNPNTDAQVAARNRVRDLTIHWQNTLTQVQRDAWDLYAQNVPWLNKLGDSILLTGLAMYVRSNTIVLQAGLTRVDAAPTIFNLASAEQSLGASAAAATQQLSVTFDDTAAWCSEDGASQLLFMGAPQNAARTFFGGPYKYLTQIDGDSLTPPTSPVAAIPTVWPFGAGQRIWVQSRILRADGRLSQLAQVNFLAGP